MTTAEGLGAVHCAAAADAPELILLLVEKHKLDPTQAITRDPKDGDAPYLFPEPVLGDTPMHLAARYDNVAAFEALHGTLDLGMAGPLNSEGECPMGVAISVNARAVLKYIKRLGKPRLSSPDEARRMLLKRRIEDVN
ncbi:uncharacterized protein B0H64DRAFT_379192 [Chaetomium fimeti]|uniref:Uncharacterized protein n=1 Tax=Chaetomium fimeti TaxID=1854472 RepID=A0AAE0HNG1_9PEZI|nr:hypothetical protein B0H64DRAFT_379192 [Chaetomium fimeti]